MNNKYASHSSICLNDEQPVWNTWFNISSALTSSCPDSLGNDQFAGIYQPIIVPKLSLSHTTVPPLKIRIKRRSSHSIITLFSKDHYRAIWLSTQHMRLARCGLSCRTKPRISSHITLSDPNEEKENRWAAWINPVQEHIGLCREAQKRLIENNK